MSEFDALDRAAPKLPGHTCPSIDAAISEADDAAGRIDEALAILKGLTGSRGQMESLRTENSDLRANATYWREQCRDLADRLEAAEERVSELETELAAAQTAEAA